MKDLLEILCKLLSDALSIISWPFKKIGAFVLNIPSCRIWSFFKKEIVAFLSMWASYRVDYGLHAHVKLAEIPNEKSEKIIMDAVFINSGNQSAVI